MVIKVLLQADGNTCPHHFILCMLQGAVIDLNACIRGPDDHVIYTEHRLTTSFEPLEKLKTFNSLKQSGRSNRLPSIDQGHTKVSALYHKQNDKYLSIIMTSCWRLVSSWDSSPARRPYSTMACWTYLPSIIHEQLARWKLWHTADLLALVSLLDIGWASGISAHKKTLNDHTYDAWGMWELTWSANNYLQTSINFRLYQKSDSTACSTQYKSQGSFVGWLHDMKISLVYWSQCSQVTLSVTRHRCAWCDNASECLKNTFSCHTKKGSDWKKSIILHYGLTDKSMLSYMIHLDSLLVVNFIEVEDFSNPIAFTSYASEINSPWLRQDNIWERHLIAFKIAFRRSKLLRLFLACIQQLFFA